MRGREQIAGASSGVPARSSRRRTSVKPLECTPLDATPIRRPPRRHVRRRRSRRRSTMRASPPGRGRRRRAMVGKLGGLAAEERTGAWRQPSATPLDDVGDALGVEPADRDVIVNSTVCAAVSSVVHAHRHEGRARIAQPAGLALQHELGADSVGAGDEHRVAIGRPPRRGRRSRRDRRARAACASRRRFARRPTIASAACSETPAWS